MNPIITIQITTPKVKDIRCHPKDNIIIRKEYRLFANLYPMRIPRPAEIAINLKLCLATAEKIAANCQIRQRYPTVVEPQKLLTLYKKSMCVNFN